MDKVLLQAARPGASWNNRGKARGADSKPVCYFFGDSTFEDEEKPAAMANQRTGH